MFAFLIFSLIQSQYKTKFFNAKWHNNTIFFQIKYCLLYISNVKIYTFKYCQTSFYSWIRFYRIKLKLKFFSAKRQKKYQSRYIWYIYCNIIDIFNLQCLPQTCDIACHFITFFTAKYYYSKIPFITRTVYNEGLLIPRILVAPLF